MATINVGDGNRIETAQRCSDALLAGQKRVLEIIVGGESLSQILDMICRIVEDQSDDVLASFLLADENGNIARAIHTDGRTVPNVHSSA